MLPLSKWASISGLKDSAFNFNLGKTLMTSLSQEPTKWSLYRSYWASESSLSRMEDLRQQRQEPGC